jgi:hypothetical protein
MMAIYSNVLHGERETVGEEKCEGVNRTMPSPYSQWRELYVLREIYVGSCSWVCHKFRLHPPKGPTRIPIAICQNNRVPPKRR